MKIRYEQEMPSVEVKNSLDYLRFGNIQLDAQLLKLCYRE